MEKIVSFDEIKNEGFVDFNKSNYVPKKHRLLSKMEQQQRKFVFPNCPQHFPECKEIHNPDHPHKDCKVCPYYKGDKK